MGLFDFLKPAAAPAPTKRGESTAKTEVDNALQLAARGDSGAVEALSALIARSSESDDIGFALAKLVYVLGGTGDPRAVAPLIEFLERPDPSRRTIGMILTEGMARIYAEQKQSEGRFVNLVGSDLRLTFHMASPRKEALYALGRLRDARAVPTLQRWLSGDEKEFPTDERRVAAASLGWIGDSVAADALLDLSRRDGGYAGRAAKGALQLIEAQAKGESTGPVYISAATEGADGNRRVGHLMVIRCGSNDPTEAESLATKSTTVLRERGYTFDNALLNSVAFSLPFHRMWFDLPMMYGHLRATWPTLPKSGLMPRIGELWLRDDTGEFCGYACVVLADSAETAPAPRAARDADAELMAKVGEAIDITGRDWGGLPWTVDPARATERDWQRILPGTYVLSKIEDGMVYIRQGGAMYKIDLGDVRARWPHL